MVVETYLLQVYPTILSALCCGLIHTKQTSEGVQHLKVSFERLTSKHVEASAIQDCLLSILDATAGQGNLEEFGRVQEMCQQYSLAWDDIGGSQFKSAQMILKSQALWRAGHTFQVGITNKVILLGPCRGLI